MDKQKLSIVGFIFARGGSKGIPRKNIKLLCGKPLICYAIEAAKASSLVNRVIVSTDDGEIASVAKDAGAEVPFIRPAELAADDSPEWLSWKHAVKEIQAAGEKIDLFVAVPATSPLRNVKDIDRCIQKLLEDGQADAVITVCKAQRHPSFNMVFLNAEEKAGIAMPSEENIYRRQQASELYDITTVAYAVRPDYILAADSLFQGSVKAVVVPRERALDIDTEFDFKLARLLMEDRNHS